MNRTCSKLTAAGRRALPLTMLLVLVAAVSAPAQTYPVAFPQPTTFILNNDVGGSISAVQTAAVGDFNGDGRLDVVSMENPGGYLELDAALGNGDGTFQYPLVQNLMPGNGQTRYSMAVGDFNGDHLLDLAIWGIYAPTNSSQVEIYLGTGSGTFSYSNAYTAPNSGNLSQGPTSLAVVDLDGNGKLDLAALTPYNGVFIYMGNGDGTFQSAIAYSTVDPNHSLNSNAYAMAAGDLNGDGKPDLAVTESAGMAALLNNGSGAFASATYYDAGLAGGTGSIGIAMGDLNGDKKNDIVMTSQPNGKVIAFLNQGSGTFTLKGLVTQLGVYSSWLISMADINGDKKTDLAITDNTGEVHAFYGKGDGTFTTGPIYPLQWQELAPASVVLADFNGDGALDIFKAADQFWLGQVTLGRGDGTFQGNPAYGWGVTGFGHNLVTADFNGDGFPDVAFSYAHSLNMPAFGVMLGSLHGALGAPTYNTFLSTTCSGSYPEWIASGDVNSDGKTDIVATLTNNSNTGCPINQVAVFTGQGTGKFKAPVMYSTGVAVQSTDVFLADMNRDGKADLVISNTDGSLSVLLNKGNGTFGTAKLITSVAALNPHLNSFATGDFNGDGKLDIAVATYGYTAASNNNVYLLLGNGNGTFQTPITAPAAPQNVYTTTLGSGDFNNDGKLDLLVTLVGSYCPVTDYGSAAYVVLQGNGTGQFTAGPITCTGSSHPVYPVISDLNGDGKLDAFIPVLQPGYGHGSVLLQGNGDDTFTRIGGDYTQTGSWLGQNYVGATSYGAVVADFDGDGSTDVAVLNNNIYYTVDYVTFVAVMFNSTQPVRVSPLNLNYGSVAVGSSKSLTVVLTNDQKTALTINSITVSGANAGEFTASSNCGTSRKAGWECTITVKFAPTVLGVQTAALNIKDSAGTQTVQLTSTNPKPTITSLTPGNAQAGGPAFTLTVGGTGFIGSSVVNWVGSPRSTTYISATEVAAQITAADISKAGSYNVTVTNPAPGGGASAAVVFTVN